MEEYDFLVLAVIFALPGAVVFLVRPDLRKVIGRMSIAALPFAATEFLFYPDYWSPNFLFDLVNVIGFGLEDLLFVAGLAAFTSTGYALFFRRRYVARAPLRLRWVFFRAAAAIGGALSVMAVLVMLAVPVIYGTVGVMLAAAGVIAAHRRELLWPGLAGGLIAASVYTALCLFYALLLPGVFERVWHTESFLDRMVLGVPLEELLYGFGAGLIATVFYPYVFDETFAPR